MKKILHIQVLPKLSGVQRISYEILKSLSSDEYDKYILFSDSQTTGDRQNLIDMFSAVGVKVLFSSKLKREICWRDFEALMEIYQLCREFRFDIVHTHSTKPGIIGRIAATTARVPLIVHTVHGLSFHKFIRFPKWQFYWMCEMMASLFCDRIVLVNKYYRRYFHWLGEKVSTIYNGIDFKNLSQISVARNYQSENLKFLFVGRLDAQKNPIILLQVAKKLIEKYPSVSFSIVGDGELYSQCESFIHAHHMGDNIHLIGWQNNVEEYYLSHDIFIIPSIYEAFGLIFLEAGYNKLPVIATNVEGIPEVVKDGHTGLLSAPNDIDAMVQNCERLILNPKLRKALGEHGYKRVTTMFSVQKMTTGYINIYDSLR